MKKTIFLLSLVALTFGYSTSTSAQNSNSRDNRRQEMQARQTERLVKDLKLSGDQQKSFETIYSKYLAELAETRQDGNRNRQADRDSRDKELSETEATAQLNEVFTRQEEQIRQQQLRLDIQRKYCAELSSVLTPQQLLRVFQPQQQNRQGDARQGGARGGFGGQGGPRGGFGGGFGGPGRDF